MFKSARATWVPKALMAVFVALAGAWAHADGTETLGPPTIALSGGSGFAVGGVGLSEEIGERQFVNLDGDIVVNVPTDAVVKQVILYWVGEFYPQSGGDAFASVNGIPVVGQPIGGPTNFFSVVWFEAYRVDITGLGLVAPGVNVLRIADLNFSYRTTGAGVLVVYDNGKGADLQLLDGLDLAYWRLAPPLDAIVPQTFHFDPAPVARQAHLPLHVASVGNDRPNITEVIVGGETLYFYDLFTSMDGPEWDSQLLPVTIPAGADELTITLYSADGLNSGKNPASLGWVAGGLAIEDPDSPEEPCGPCEGKVKNLTLRYNGTAAAHITVTYRDGSKTKTAFDGVVQAGGEFSFVGADKQGTLGPEITVRVNGTVNTKIHTSCSQPIGPGQTYGAFTIVAGASRNGGLLCPLNGGGTPPPPPPGGSCKPCDGKVTQLTLAYQGTAANAAVAVTYRDGSKTKTAFNGVVQPGATFSFVGGDKQGTLGPEISVFVNGMLNARIHTSCSQPIGPGLTAGDFKVVSGASRNGGLLCPLNGGGTPGGGGGGTPGGGDEYCETGKPLALTFRYTGQGCEASNNQQTSKNFECAGNPQGAGQVRIVAADHHQPGQARVFFDGLVSLNGAFEVSAEAVGLTRMKANLYLSVYSASGNQLLQTLKIHVSCSEPLNAGDQFGSLKLVGYASDRGVVSGGAGGDASVDTLPAFGCGATGAPAGRAAAGDVLAVLAMMALLGGFALRRSAARA